MQSMLSNKRVECPAGLLSRAKQLSASVPTAIVNAGADLPMMSAKLAFEEGLIEPVLVGDGEVIRAIAKRLQWDITSLRVVTAESEQEAAQRSAELARDGEVAALMKGDVHTDNLLKAVLKKDNGLRTGNRLSHVFYMTLAGSDDSLCITDGAINVLPSLEDKIHITRNAIALLHRLGNSQPKVAVLSATEQASPAMQSSVDAAEIVARAQTGELFSEEPGAVVEGPFAFDNAVSREAAEMKGMNSEVAGQPDILVVPNIEAGNIAFKQMVYFMGACAAGIVLGAKVPITLTSRADPAAARLASTALASLYASAG
ncbi:MAG: bifunctional enoyl-CoA hydratase/phosphate acetyltransferase [Pseudomonadales bacterium]